MPNLVSIAVEGPIIPGETLEDILAAGGQELSHKLRRFTLMVRVLFFKGVLFLGPAEFSL
jgi:hypothetical protein